MTGFEKYLIDNGWEKFVMNTNTMELERTDKHIISTMVNLDHRYFKDGNQIIFGLSEKGKPCTLIYPRPNRVRNDDEMNRILWDLSPEKVLELLNLN